MNDPQSKIYSLEDMYKNKDVISAQHGNKWVQRVKQNMSG